MKVQDYIREHRNQFLREDNQYTDFIKNKRVWYAPTIPKYAKDETTPGRLACLQKLTALALELELQVGEWVIESLHSVPDSAKYALVHNAQDEITHETGFQSMAQALDIPGQYMDEARYIHEDFQEMGHPILLTAYAELGIFFVTLSMMRKYGNYAVKLFMGDVARDEAAHVKLHWYIAEELGLEASPKLEQLRRDTVAWLSPPKDKDFWLTQSDKLVKTKVAPDLEFTKAGLVTAHFEVPNSAITRY